VNFNAYEPDDQLCIFHITRVAAVYS